MTVTLQGPLSLLARNAGAPTRADDGAVPGDRTDRPPSSFADILAAAQPRGEGGDADRAAQGRTEDEPTDLRLPDATSGTALPPWLVPPPPIAAVALALPNGEPAGARDALSAIDAQADAGRASPRIDVSAAPLVPVAPMATAANAADPQGVVPDSAGAAAMPMPEDVTTGTNSALPMPEASDRARTPPAAGSLGGDALAAVARALAPVTGGDVRPAMPPTSAAPASAPKARRAAEADPAASTPAGTSATGAESTRDAAPRVAPVAASAVAAAAPSAAASSADDARAERDRKSVV